VSLTIREPREGRSLVNNSGAHEQRARPCVRFKSTRAGCHRAAAPEGPRSSHYHARSRRDPIPHLTVEPATALREAEPGNTEQTAARALSDELIAEIKAADTLVVGAPVYNFGIASTLKTWFDYVLRAGIIFQYGESGPVGLLKGKRAIVIESRGGLYSEGLAKAMDSQEPHLRNLLALQASPISLPSERRSWHLALRPAKGRSMPHARSSQKRSRYRA
jgi:NAD(P)H-dependent FMN reductase